MITSNVQQELVELTKELIRIPSSHSRQDEIHRCTDFIAHWLTRHDISFTRNTINNAPSITVLPQMSQIPILLMSHFDVVEADDHSLFDPQEVNGNLHGRGAIDDKYAVALSIILYREHLTRIRRTGGSQEDMNFGLLLTGDEEVGGADCAGTAAEYIDTEFFIAIDGGNPKLIVNKEKGILQLELTARGEEAHAARPWLGQSAFDILIDDYRTIQQIFSTTTDDHWHKTMVLSSCQTGNGSINIVPDKATATLDIRFTEHDDPDELLAAIMKSVRSEITVRAKEPVFASGPSPYLDLLVHHSDAARVGFEHGASDARYFSKKGIAGVVFGAEGEMSQHTKNEHIVLASLFDLYDRLDRYFLDVETRLRTR